MREEEAVLWLGTDQAKDLELNCPTAPMGWLNEAGAGTKFHT